KREPEVAPDEASTGGRDREVERGIDAELVARLEQASLDAAEHVLRAQRLAAMRERDDDALAGAHELRELRLGLREPACRDRRPLRLEGEGLRLRKRVELARAFQAQRVEPLL